MGERMRLVSRAIRKTMEDPRRARSITRKAGGKLKYMISPPSYGALQWGPDGWERRAYEGYEEYVRHQAAKLDTLQLKGYDSRYRRKLRFRLEGDGVEWRGQSVLCLGARIGTEVKAFVDEGAFAIGLDLNPGPGNRFVVVGDFHEIQYADACVDAIFSNSLDHSRELSSMLCEVGRVLKEGGLFIVEAPVREKGFDEWAAISWPSIDSLIGVIEGNGFELQSRMNIEDPYNGEHLRFIRGCSDELLGED